MQKVHSIKESRFFLVQYNGTGTEDGWGDEEIVQKTPVPRVRELLGGRWESSKDYEDFAMKVFFNGQRRVLVMGFKPEMTQDQVLQALQQIRDGREDLS